MHRGLCEKYDLASTERWYEQTTEDVTLQRLQIEKGRHCDLLVSSVTESLRQRGLTSLF